MPWELRRKCTKSTFSEGKYPQNFINVTELSHMVNFGVIVLKHALRTLALH